MEVDKEGFVIDPTRPNDSADASQPDTSTETDEVEAEAEDVVEGVESEAESQTADEEDVEKKTESVQKRIDELTGKWRGSQREIHERDQKIEELQKQLESKAEAKPESDTLKTLADFDHDEGEYQSYVLEKARQEAKATAEEVYNQHRKEQSQTDAMSDYRSKEGEFAKTVDDYYSVAHDKYLPLNESMRDIIIDSDIGPEIHYYLGKNPDVSGEIARLSLAASARRMVEIENQIKSEKAKPKKSVSEAPPPPPGKLGGGEPGKRISTTDVASDKLSDEEWFKREEKRTAKMRG